VIFDTNAPESRVRSRVWNTVRMTTGTPSSGLSDREQRMLVFERTWWSYDGGRDAAIREQFDVSPADYHRALGELIDRPEAADFDPLLVRRLRRRRTVRTRERSARRLERS
jgi:hypothetical protein